MYGDGRARKTCLRSAPSVPRSVPRAVGRGRGGAGLTWPGAGNP